MRIYEFAALYTPKDDGDKKTAEKPALLIPPTVILARDEREATIQAARKIPDDYLDKLDCVEIAIRPF